MKKVYTNIPLMFILFLWTSLLFAQAPKISGGINDMIGQQLKIIEAQISNVDQGESGKNAVWNFNNLHEKAQHSVFFIKASNAPNSSKFPGSTIAVRYNPEVGLGSLQAKYEFYSESDNGLILRGLVNNIDELLTYTDAQTLLTYPFTYQSNNADDFKAAYSLSTGIDVTEDGSINTVADAYGTLNLPYGTFEEVLRVKITKNYTQTISGNGFDDSFQYTEEIYNWYHCQIGYPVLTIFTQTVTLDDGTKSTVANVRYLEVDEIPEPCSAISGIEDTFVDFDLNLYPNPTEQYSQIDFNLKQNASLSVYVYNALGQVVSVVTEQQFYTSGTHRLNLDLGQVPAGMYFVELQVDNTYRQVQQLIKR